MAAACQSCRSCYISGSANGAISSVGQSACSTRRRSQVQVLYRPVLSWPQNCDLGPLRAAASSYWSHPSNFALCLTAIKTGLFRGRIRFTNFRRPVPPSGSSCRPPSGNTPCYPDPRVVGPLHIRAIEWLMASRERDAFPRDNPPDRSRSSATGCRHSPCLRRPSRVTEHHRG